MQQSTTTAKKQRERQRRAPHVCLARYAAFSRAEADAIVLWIADSARGCSGSATERVWAIGVVVSGKA